MTRWLPVLLLAGCLLPERPEEEDRDPLDINDCSPAEERCNDIDDDCDGLIDEEGGPLWYSDEDGDGWGIEDGAIASCEPVAERVEMAGDCDDLDPTRYPGATPDPNDGIDQDCDGTPETAVDLDGDGHSDERFGGDDCRDDAPMIWGPRCENVLAVRDGKLYELDPFGTQVKVMTIPHPTLGNVEGAGITIGDHGLFYVINGEGTQAAVMSVYDEENGLWDHHPMTDLVVGNTPSGGGVASEAGLTFLADSTDGSTLGGVVEFLSWIPDYARWQGTTSLSLLDVSVRNGMLYALTDNNQVRAYDWGTESPNGATSLPLSADARALEPGPNYDLWTADGAGALVVYDLNGAETDRMATALATPNDIDIDGDGRVVVGGDGGYALTDVSLSSETVFSVGTTAGPTYVTFFRP